MRVLGARQQQVLRVAQDDRGGGLEKDRRRDLRGLWEGAPTKILSRVSIIAISMLFAGLIPVAAAQSKDWRHEPAADPKITQISLGNTYNTPGTFVVVPIYFKPADGVQVGRLKLEVDFPSAYLKFEKLERGIAADIGVVDLSSEVTAYKNDQGEETSKLTLVGSLASKESPAKGLASGLLANLTFRIN